MQPIRQIKHIFWLSTLGVCFIALLSIPSAGFLASLYTDDPAVITVVKHLIWMNALFMPIWAASWVLPAGEGAKDASYTMWVALAGMWGCRIIAGYILGGNARVWRDGGYGWGCSWIGWSGGVLFIAACPRAVGYGATGPASENMSRCPHRITSHSAVPRGGQTA